MTPEVAPEPSPSPHGKRCRRSSSLLLTLAATLAAGCQQVELDGIDPLIGDVEPDHLGVRLATGSFHRLTATNRGVAMALDEHEELIVLDPWDRSLCRAGPAPEYELVARTDAKEPRVAGSLYPANVGSSDLSAEPQPPTVIAYQTEVGDDGFGSVRVVDQRCNERAAMSDARLVWPEHRDALGSYVILDRSQQLYHVDPRSWELRLLGTAVSELAISSAHFWLIEGGEVRVLDLDHAELGRLGRDAASLLLEPGYESPDAVWFEDDAGVHRATVWEGEIVDELREPGACELERSWTGMASMVSPCSGGELVAYNATGSSTAAGGFGASIIPQGHRLALGDHPASPVEVYAVAGKARFFYESLEAVGDERVGTLWGSALEREPQPIAERVLVAPFRFPRDGSSGYRFLANWDGERGTLLGWSTTGEVRVVAEDVHELSGLGDLAITGHDGTRGTLVRTANDAPPTVLLEDVVSERFAYQDLQTQGFLVISAFDGEQGTLSAVPYLDPGPATEIARRVRPTSSAHGWAAPEYGGVAAGVRHDVVASTGLGALTLRSPSGATAEVEQVSEWVPVFAPSTGVAVLAARESGLWLAWLP